MELIAVDPGVHKDHASATFVDGVLVRLEMGRDVVPVGRPDVLAIESQVVYGQDKARDMINLAHAAGELVGRLQERWCLLQVVYVMPRDWKGAAPKPETKREYEARGYATEHQVRSRLASAEAGLLSEAQERYGKQWQKKLDLVDAVGIGLHHLGRLSRT